MDRKLIDYLPPFIQEYKEIKAIMDAEQVSAENVWTDAESVLADQFVQDATENGVARYEKILGITPKGTYTLNERKFNIFARMNEQLPYTLESLESALISLCGEDGYTLKLDTNAYTLTVKLALANEHNVEAVENLLKKMIPANLIRNVRLFNTYTLLADLTYAQLGAYTYKQLREEIV